MARAALEGIAWRVADIVAAIRETVPVDVLRVDGGLTNERLMLELQADAIGAPVERGTADATARAPRRWPPSAPGGSPRRPTSRRCSDTEERVEPRRDDAWREREHAAWRRFVELALELERG